MGLALSFLWQYVRWLVRTGRRSHFIHPGASGTLGVLGYVNAALEIKVQLAQMVKSEPEAIFVAVGSCGTLAGLLLGARLAGLKSRIVGVRVIEENVANRSKIARMVNKAARYLRRCDSSAPLIRVTPDEVNLLDDYLGSGYGHPTQGAVRAVERAARMEKLPCFWGEEEWDVRLLDRDTGVSGLPRRVKLDHPRAAWGARRDGRGALYGLHCGLPCVGGDRSVSHAGTATE